MRPRLYVTPERLHPELAENISHRQIASPPTLRNRAEILHEAFLYFEDQVQEQPGAAASLKASIVSFLYARNYGLAKSEKALRWMFWAKHKAWQAGERTVDAILDRRRGRAGLKRRQLCPACLIIMIDATVDQDGDVSTAFRRLHKKFCADCVALFPFDPLHKSYVPQCVRKQIAPDVAKKLSHRRGPKNAALNGPYIRRIPNFGPGDVFIADDFTFNIAWWHQEPGGPVQINRGECLLACDLRTDYPLRYVLISSPVLLAGEDGHKSGMRRASYTSRHCRLLISRLAQDIGLPRREVVLENGSWRNGLMNDLPRTGWNAVAWNETADDLAAKLGFRIRYVKPCSPRSKARIERLGGMLQELMRCESGFVGFNERLDKREETDDLIRQVRAGKLPPEGVLPSMARMLHILDKTMEEFRREKQNGAWLPGVSPEEAWLNGIRNPDGSWQSGISARPLRKTPAELNYYLATYKCVRKVGEQGLKIRDRVYWGEALERFKHQEVEVRCDIADLSVIYVAEPGSTEFVAVQEMTLPAMGATREQLEGVNRQKAAFTRPSRVAFDNMTHPLRTSLVDDNAHGSEEDKARGRSIAAQKERVDKSRSQDRQTKRRLAPLAAAAGVPVPTRVVSEDDAARALEFLQELRRDELQDQETML